MHDDQHSALAGLKSASAMPQLTAFAPDAATYLIIPALQLPLSLLATRHSAMLRTAAVNAIGLVLVNVPATACATCIWFVTSKITVSCGIGTGYRHRQHEARTRGLAASQPKHPLRTRNHGPLRVIHGIS
jgi:hypothetical protein